MRKCNEAQVSQAQVSRGKGRGSELQTEAEVHFSICTLYLYMSLV
jgi:hypothetical protein